MKFLMMKKAMNTFLLFSLTTVVATTVTAQEVEELTTETINQEVDQELATLGQNPNSKTHTSTVKRVTKTSKVQTAATPVVVSSTAAPVAAQESKKTQTVVTTKTINELPVKVPVKTTTVKTTTTVPQPKAVVKKSTVQKSTVVPGVAAPMGVQKQPVTFVEASPLSESRADEIRRRRQDEEMRTESKIVEKLEQSRMEDERRRAEALFGDRMNAAQPAPVVIEPEDQTDKMVSQEVEAAPLALEQTTMESETNISEIQKAPGFFDTKFVGLTAGVPAYPDYSNIKGNYNVGIKFGMGHDRFLFELGLSMAEFVLDETFYGYGPYSNLAQSNYIYNYSSNGQYIDERADFEMRQYSGSLGSRYQILDGFIRPNVGGEFVYSYRQTTSLEPTRGVNSNGAAIILAEGTDYGNSHALDFGLTAGVDLAVNPSFTIGADFRYLINVAHRINTDYPTAGTPIEKLQHFVGGLSAVFKF